MLKTEIIIIQNGKTRELGTVGKWFRLRNLTAAAAPTGTILSLITKVLAAGERQRTLADNVTLYEGDRLSWDDDRFEQLVFTNNTGYDITAEVRASDQGSDDIQHVKIDNFPDVGGSTLQATADVNIANAEGVKLLIAANANRRSVTIGSKLSNPPGATPLRIGDANITDARGAQLGVGGEHTFDTKGAIYGKNPDAANPQDVTILELLN